MLNSCLRSAFSIAVVSCGIAVTSGLAQTDQQIYTDSLQNNWQDWSWSCTDDFSNTSVVHAGANAISVTLTAAWGAFSLHHNDMDSSPYTNLTFWINGGPAGGQRLQLAALLGDVSGGTVAGTSNLVALAANTWQQVTVPLAALGVANQPNFYPVLASGSNRGSAAGLLPGRHHAGCEQRSAGDQHSRLHHRGCATEPAPDQPAHLRRRLRLLEPIGGCELHR